MQERIATQRDYSILIAAFNAYASMILTRDFRPLKNNPDIRHARKVRGGEKKPEGKKKPRMVVAVDETFPQGQVGTNRARKAGKSEGEAIREGASENEQKQEDRRATARRIKKETTVKR